MPQQVFGPEAAVSMLNRALNDQSPSNAVFKNQVASAGTTDASINAFANTFLGGFKTLTDDALSTKVLTNMGLLPNAELQAALRDYFAANGAANRGVVVLQLSNILAGLENATGSLAVYAAAASAWNNEVTGAYEYSVNTANTAPSTTGGNNVGTNFNLTVNQDTMTGTGANDTFTAGAAQDGGGNLINTLQSVDAIDGGAGTDTLNATLATATTVAPTVKNIENVNARYSNANAILDLVGASGFSGVTVADSTTAGQLNNIGALSALTINNQNTNFSVGGTAGSSTTLALNSSTVGKSTALITLDLGATAASKVTTLNATLNGAYINLDSTNADVVTSLNATATGANALTLTDSAATVTKIVTSGAGSLDLSAVTLGALTSLDGTAETGALKVKVYNAAKAVTISTGGGDDVVNLTATAPVAGSSVSTGAGNDQILAFAGLATLDKGVNGGDGTDIINISDAATLTSTTAKYITNVETLDVSGGKANYDVSLNSFATVQIDEAVGGALAAATTFTNAGKAFTLNIMSKAKTNADFAVGQTIDVSLKDSTGTTAKGTAESFTLTASINDGDANNTAKGSINANTVTVAGVENLIVDANVKTLDGGTSATKASAHNLTVNFVAAAAETLTIKGDAKAIISGTGTVIGVVNKVDATANTGGVQLDLTNATAAAGNIAYTGGDGVDTFSSGSGGAIVYGGKGADSVTFIADGTKAVRDTYVLKAATDAQISDTSKDGTITIAADTGFDTVTNFKTGTASTDDRLDLTNFGFTGAQRGLADVTASVQNATNITSVANLFSTPAGARGVAQTIIGADTYILIDANKDGNFTAADDVIVKLVAVAGLNEASINF